MTKWALTNFLAWQTSRNEEFDGDQAKQVRSTLLESSDPSILSKWLSLYCAEARKKDGGSYPPKTVYALLTGICAATGATEMYHAGVPEKVIQERMGHHLSLSGLGQYERTSGEQQRTVSRILSSCENVLY